MKHGSHVQSYSFSQKSHENTGRAQWEAQDNWPLPSEQESDYETLDLTLKSFTGRGTWPDSKDYPKNNVSIHGKGTLRARRRRTHGWQIQVGKQRSGVACANSGVWAELKPWEMGSSLLSVSDTESMTLDEQAREAISVVMLRTHHSVGSGWRVRPFSLVCNVC